MAIKKNEQNHEKKEVVPKNHKTLLKVSKSATQKEEKKVGRKAFDDENLKADKRNTFLLNAYQQEKMEERMKELGLKNKTDYILSLLKRDIIDL